MAEWNSSRTKNRLDSEIRNTINYETLRLEDKINTMSKEVELLKTQPLKIVMGIVTVFGMGISGIVYNAISDHIEIKNQQHTIKAIVNRLDHGKSRGYTDVQILKHKLKDLEEKIKNVTMDNKSNVQTSD